MSEKEIMLLRFEGGSYDGATLQQSHRPWPLPDVLQDPLGGFYFKYSQSKLEEHIPGVLRGAIYKWKAETP